MKRLHIAFFTNTYYPTMSGVVRSVSTFRQQLTEMGHNVFVFAQHTSAYEDAEPFIFRYPAIEVPINDYALPIPVSPFISEVLPILKLDVIHSHHPFLLGQVAANKAKELHLPHVFTFHTRYEEYSHYVPFSQELTKRVILDWVLGYMEQCQHIITPSESMKQILEESGVAGDYITTIPTGIDVEPFRQADGEVVRHQRGWDNDLVLISVGRLAKEKNFETLLVAAAEVMRKRNQVRLVLIGDGPERKALEELAGDLGIAPRVEFAGRVEFAEIPAYLRAADVFCFASVTETQGLVTMEAMAAGLPIVAVDATGTSDAVTHGQEGLLTENDSAALAQAIQRMVDDAALRQQFKTAAAKKVAWFDIKAQAKKVLEVYERAIEDKKVDLYVDIKRS
ncbi:MAG: glycosyltransferase family 4 protein [Anaerolineales bacterium]|nr:glycosyltransferase family 4 protein [Anaerolineales bacterium]